jgi:hypothetical protein
MKSVSVYIFLFITALKANAQVFQFSQPVKLGPEINSADEELAPMLSPDGQTLYFSRAFHTQNTGGKYAGTDIWISRKDSTGKWTPAVNAGYPWNNKRSNAVIGISADGTTVYLLNAYTNKSGISSSRLVNGSWTKPEFIPVPGINRDDFVGIYMHPSLDVMLISMKGNDSFGEEDLYITLKDTLGNWNQPKNLGPTINTQGFEITPYLSADKGTLVFSSNQHPGYGGSDIFLTQRLFGSWDVWTKPQNLGSTVNSSAFDAYFTIQDSIVYFSSARDDESAKVYSASFKIKTDSLQQKVKSIVTEAQSILADLNKPTSESTTTMVITKLYYAPKSIEIDSQGYIQLSKAIDDYTKLNVVQIIVRAVSNEFETAQLNYSISEQRVNTIIDAFRAALGSGVNIKSDIIVESAIDKRAFVEIHYVIK